jgi:NADH:ubiquinone oxidoreductase subunit K
MAVAAAEAAVGLAIFVQLYRTQKTIHVDEIHLMKW